MTRESRAAATIDLGGHNLRGALVTEAGELLFRTDEPTAAGREPEAVLRQIVDVTRRLEGEAGRRSVRVAGVGLGIPGFLDQERGVVLASPSFPLWREVPLVERLSGLLPRDYVLDNDANCAVLGEWWKGAAAGARHVVLLTLGTGVGGGVISEGRPLRGRLGAGAELGHMVVEPDGPACGCGGTGCLETLVSGGALQRRFGVTAEELARRARSGDSAAQSAFRQVGRYLGIATSSFGQIFSPEVVVLGGRVSRSMDLFLPALRAEVAVRLRNHPSREMRVVAAALGDDAGLVGAARLVFPPE